MAREIISFHGFKELKQKKSKCMKMGFADEERKRVEDVVIG